MERAAHEASATTAGDPRRVVSWPYRHRRPELSLRRRLAGWLALALGLPGLTTALVHASDDRLAAGLLLYLGVVLAAGLIGGHGPGIVGAISSATAANYFIVPPVHRLTIAKTTDVVALAVFVTVAVTVSTLVNRAARLSKEAARARAEAEALAASTATLVTEIDPLPSLLERLCATLPLRGASVFTPVAVPAAWHLVAMAGESVSGPDDAHILALGDVRGAILAVHPREPLNRADLGLLEALARQLSLALAARELQATAAHAAALEQADALRTAILQAVSHDLRTPLSAIKAAASSLLSDEVDWPPAAIHQFHRTIDTEADRLNGLVGNLLDMSRLQAGPLDLRLEPVALDEIVWSAVVSLSDDTSRIVVDIPEHTPLAHADPALVERAIANLLANALDHAPPNSTVRLEGGGAGDEVVLRIIDRGPGVPTDQLARIVEPFQRLGDTGHGTGVGLGLAVANGFVRAMGGRLAFEATPGGGLTVSVVLPTHRRASTSENGRHIP